jgi:2-amino-4-hydroxy-6-hydroxymethyldihydropteridine diphosphokinase
MKEVDVPLPEFTVISVAIGIGANRGNPLDAITQALEQLRRGGVLRLRRAPLYRTRPVACDPETPEFVNTAVTGLWRGSPLALLALCQAIEQALGRPAAHSSRAARELDLDVLLVGERWLDSAALTVPHPRLTQRLFVLVPLAEIAPDWRLPPTLETVAACRDRLLQEPGAELWGRPCDG